LTDATEEREEEMRGVKGEKRKKAEHTFSGGGGYEEEMLSPFAFRLRPVSKGVSEGFERPFRHV
jgi:hypothetical protein